MFLTLILLQEPQVSRYVLQLLPELRCELQLQLALQKRSR
jgi:hypothetical protein